jgi:TetR/AcrR family transcriptional regulator, mexJK operon transcriptional repressor
VSGPDRPQWTGYGRSQPKSENTTPQVFLSEGWYFSCLPLRITYGIEPNSDELVGLHRLVIAESARFPELAQTLHSSGDARHIARLAEHIRAERGPGSEPLAEPLFSLLLGEKHRRRLLGIDPAPTPAEAARHANAALAQLGLRSAPSQSRARG